jgi:hypothetical protein
MRCRYIQRALMDHPDYSMKDIATIHWAQVSRWLGEPTKCPTSLLPRGLSDMVISDSVGDLLWAPRCCHKIPLDSTHQYTNAHEIGDPRPLCPGLASSHDVLAGPMAS